MDTIEMSSMPWDFIACVVTDRRKNQPAPQCVSQKSGEAYLANRPSLNGLA